ncbi:MAG: ribonuclease P protein component [Ruthenibacterium sp.]
MRYRTLTRNSDFSRTYARGKSFVHPCLVLYVNKNRLGRMRVGLTATKKVGNAVKRNRARRVMRAALEAVLPAEVCTARGLDLVLVARGMTTRVKMQRVANALEKLLQKAGVLCSAPAETSAQISATQQTSAETSAQTSAARQTPTQTSAETPTQTSAETPAQTTAQTSAQASAQAPPRKTPPQP